MISPVNKAQYYTSRFLGIDHFTSTSTEINKIAMSILSFMLFLPWYPEGKVSATIFILLCATHHLSYN